MRPLALWKFQIVSSEWIIQAFATFSLEQNTLIRKSSRRAFERFWTLMMSLWDFIAVYYFVDKPIFSMILRFVTMRSTYCQLKRFICFYCCLFLCVCAAEWSIRSTNVITDFAIVAEQRTMQKRRQHPLSHFKSLAILAAMIIMPVITSLCNLMRMLNKTDKNRIHTHPLKCVQAQCQSYKTNDSV